MESLESSEKRLINISDILKETLSENNKNYPTQQDSNKKNQKSDKNNIIY